MNEHKCAGLSEYGDLSFPLYFPFPKAIQPKSKTLLFPVLVWKGGKKKLVMLSRLQNYSDGREESRVDAGQASTWGKEPFLPNPTLIFKSQSWLINLSQLRNPEN